MTEPITVTGTDIAFPCEPGQTVLEAAERAGWVIPYSCRKGVCTTCSATVASGEVAVRRRGTATGPADNVLLCQAEPHGPVEITPRRIEHRAPPARKTITAAVYRIRRPAERITVLELRFPIGRRAPFRAGQYLYVRLPDGDTRPYSMANAPAHNDAAELHVRTEPGGAFSDRMAGALRQGDQVTVELPFGECCVDHQDTAPILLLATGTGFAPIKSMVLDQIARRGNRPMHLYWGARTAPGLYLAGLAEHWARRYPWFRFTPVLSRPDARWSGRTGWVQHAAIADHPDLRAHRVYACGSEPMTTGARDILCDRAGLPDEHFHADAFVPAADPAAAVS